MRIFKVLVLSPTSKETKPSPVVSEVLPISNPLSLVNVGNSGVGVKVGAGVAVAVGIRVGVTVGPSNCPGPQPATDMLIANKQIVIINRFGFICLLRYHGRTRLSLRGKLN
jgi:hypothetical protein